MTNHNLDSTNCDERPIRRILGMPKNIFFLGVVSFLTDASSDMIFGPLFTLFLKQVLGTPVFFVGFISGITEGSESFLKIFSGWFSDRIGKRKIFALLGYSLSTLAKPFLFWTTLWEQAMLLRFTDRIGKGLRTSPRDALLADSSPPEEKGRNFGFHRAMDTSGEFVGLGIAAIVLLMLQSGASELERSTYQLIVLVGTIPAIIAVVVLFIFLRETATPPATKGIAKRDPYDNYLPKHKGLDSRFKIFLVIWMIFTIGNSSKAFLALRADDLGYSSLNIVLMFMVLGAFYALSSPPAGMLSDRIGRKQLVVAGWLVFALVYVGFATVSSASPNWYIWLLFAAYGLYHGITEGAARAFVADIIPQERIGTAYGLFHGSTGIGLLAASLIAGALWESVNPAAPFIFGAVISVIAVVAFMGLVHER